MSRENTDLPTRDLPYEIIFMGFFPSPLMPLLIIPVFVAAPVVVMIPLKAAVSMFLMLPIPFTVSLIFVIPMLYDAAIRCKHQV